MFSSLVHLILSLSISHPYLIKFHDFADNSQEGMKHQMRGATQAQLGMTLRITLMNDGILCKVTSDGAHAQLLSIFVFWLDSASWLTFFSK
jgi:hypothetical protein